MNVHLHQEVLTDHLTNDSIFHITMDDEDFLQLIFHQPTNNNTYNAFYNYEVTLHNYLIGLARHAWRCNIVQNERDGLDL